MNSNKIQTRRAKVFRTLLLTILEIIIVVVMMTAACRLGRQERPAAGIAVKDVCYDHHVGGEKYAK